MKSGVGLRSDRQASRPQRHQDDAPLAPRRRRGRAAAENTADQIAELMKFGQPVAAGALLNAASGPAARLRRRPARRPQYGRRHHLWRPPGRGATRWAAPAAASSAQRTPGLGALGGPAEGQLDMFEG